MELSLIKTPQSQRNTTSQQNYPLSEWKVSRSRKEIHHTVSNKSEWLRPDKASATKERWWDQGPQEHNQNYSLKWPYYAEGICHKIIYLSHLDFWSN